MKCAQYAMTLRCYRTLALVTGLRSGRGGRSRPSAWVCQESRTKYWVCMPANCLLLFVLGDDVLAARKPYLDLGTPTQVVLLEHSQELRGSFTPASSIDIMVCAFVPGYIIFASFLSLGYGKPTPSLLNRMA